MNTAPNPAAPPNTTTKTPASPNPTTDLLRLLLQQGEGSPALPKLQSQEWGKESKSGSSVPSVASCSDPFSYEDYLKNREDIEDAKTQAEFAADLLRELGNIDVSTIHRACLLLTSLQIYKAIDEYGDEALRKM